MDTTTLRTAILAVAGVIVVAIVSMTVIAVSAGDGATAQVLDALKTLLSVIVAAIAGPVGIIVHAGIQSRAVAQEASILAAQRLASGAIQGASKLGG